MCLSLGVNAACLFGSRRYLLQKLDPSDSVLHVKRRVSKLTQQVIYAPWPVQTLSFTRGNVAALLRPLLSACLSMLDHMDPSDSVLHIKRQVSKLSQQVGHAFKPCV